MQHFAGSVCGVETPIYGVQLNGRISLLRMETARSRGHLRETHRVPSELFPTMRCRLFWTESMMVVCSFSYVEVQIRCTGKIQASVPNRMQLDVWFITCDWNVVETCAFDQVGDFSEIILRTVFSKCFRQNFTFHGTTWYRKCFMRVTITKITHAVCSIDELQAITENFRCRPKNPKSSRTTIYTGKWPCWVAFPIVSPMIHTQCGNK